MALTNAFFEAVNANDVLSIRIMMQDSLLVDRTFAEFHDMEKAAADMDGLYDAHDGESFPDDPAQWDDDYMDAVMVKVLSNFSRERLEHLKAVVRHLRPVSAPASQSASASRQTARPQSRNTKVGVGAVAGAAVGGILSSIAGASTLGVIGSIVAGAVVGGVATSLIDNGGKSS